MKFVFLVLFISIISSLSAQEINIPLKKQLDSIYHRDQALREISQPTTSKEKKLQVLSEFGFSEEEFTKNEVEIINAQDSLNLIVIKEIIEKYGYPGKTLVGEPTNKSAWYVIQHSNEIEKYFPVIKKAGEDNEIPMTLVALMGDRLLMEKGLEQIYGTQGSERWMKNEKTGKEELVTFIWPIKDPKNVNKLRKAIGFPTTVEEYAKLLGIDYKVYTLEEINSH